MNEMSFQIPTITTNIPRETEPLGSVSFIAYMDFYAIWLSKTSTIDAVNQEYDPFVVQYDMQVHASVITTIPGALSLFTYVYICVLAITECTITWRNNRMMNQNVH